MTNEEFEGHLLAALHGPNATNIADRVVCALLKRPGAELRKIGQQVNEYFLEPLPIVQQHRELLNRVLTLETLALAEEQTGKWDEHARARVTFAQGSRKKIRKYLAKTAAAEEERSAAFGKFLEVLGIEVPEKEKTDGVV